LLRRIVVAVCLLVAVVPALEGVAPAAGSFQAGGSVNQVYVTGLTPGAEVDLLDAGHQEVADGTADGAGAYLFRDVDAGSGYQVHSDGTTVGGLVVTDPDDHPEPAWYDQEAASNPIATGFGYLTTRDGTTLSVNVNFPIASGSGPWPVVVNYSGYSPSQPGNPPAESLLYLAQGYVVVGVNMRGTGCSGGAFEFMEDLQATDGYDLVELLARQTWSNGDVGLTGISYSGYSQLYVGATRPPHLDAITPLSPYSDTYSAILYPGGILNDGFAVEWATDRQDGAKPAASGWARKRISQGDTTCARNQDLRLQSRPLLDRILTTPFAEHEFDYLNTETFVDRIQVPTYLASQWQDEQTGGSAANLLPLFDPDTLVFGTFTNGTHVEPMAPSELVQVMAFMDIYVGHKVPALSPFVTSVAPGVLAQDIFRSTNVDAFALPPMPFADAPNHAAAKAGYEAQPRIRIKWENGAVPGAEGLPLGTAVTRHATWPLTGLEAEALYLHPDGELWNVTPTVADRVARSTSAYTYDPTTKRRKTLAESREEAWAPHPDVRWDPLAEGNSLSYVTAPFTETVAYAGQGSVDLWIRSSAADTDIEATLTEVRPDGQEVFIQSGWLRASHRALDPARSTELVPFHTHQAEDAAPLPAGRFTPVRIELFPFAHVIRPGSQLRLNIEAPGGNQPFWMFDALDGPSVNEVGHSVGRPSRVVLPRVPAGQTPAVPAALPACSLVGVTTQAVSLRNQPCRPYLPARTPTGVVAVAPDRADTDPIAPATVYWSAPTGPAPSSYLVVASRFDGGSEPGDPAPIEVAGDVTRVEVTLPANVAFEFRVIARYGAVAAPPSDASLPVVVAFRTGPTGPTAPTPPLSVVPPTSAPGPVPTTTSTPAVVDTPHERYVRLLYRDVLGRAPDAGGLRWWVALLDDGASRSAVAARFRRVPEVDQRVVRTLYAAYLGRDPSGDELLLWTGFVKAGGRVEEVAGALLGAPERWAAAGGDVDRFVVDLYADVLDRAPTGPEAAAARRRVEGEGTTPVATALLLSAESAGRRVDHLYDALLRRRPDPAGRAFWVARIVSGGQLVDLLFAVAATDEYAAQTPRTAGPDVLATAFG
jgi:predicted acyl esterase